MSNWQRKLEGLLKPWLIVAIFLMVFIFGLAREAKAETTIEAGGGFLSGQWSGGESIFWNEKILEGKYSFGMGYIHEQEVTPRREPRQELKENLWIQGQRRVCFMRDKNVCLGLGVAYFNAKNRALGSHFNAALSIEIRPQKKHGWGLSYRHYSNAGTQTPNMGQDILYVTYTFK